ncbi:MAG: HAMP domain-containing histidine kinase [Thiobacillaceae bacterium]|jgi:two-component system sensor histidine kinase FlrB|nr:HAMP domain-containing histidine kinase [Thiobacillaceae bacterium]
MVRRPRTPPQDPARSAPPDRDDLREAFALFSATSEKLAEAYVELQGQVARLSAELAAANGELARRERLSALGEMAAKLAHQLRTPLAAALLYVGHLGGAQLDDADRRRFAEKAMARLRYLERLIADMLAFVKGAHGERSRFPLHAMLSDMVQVMEGQAAAQGVRLLLDDPSADLDLEADRQALSGALTSLLENALQASPAGSTVRLVAQAGTGPFVAFRVEDEGPGIAEEGRERLFDPFYTTRAEGSGLGLAIVKQVADAHGGWVEVESTPGKGSRFSLFLPLRPGATS